jgi:signal transduction histidine kinase
VPEAREILNTTIDDAAQAITEARDAVQDLRSSTVVTNDLAKAVQTLGEDLAARQTATNGNAATFAVEVEGAPQDLHPILRDEIYRIAAEAVRNAFHHGRARRIEVEIVYGAQDVRVRVRDDGAGIEPHVLGQEGREGHFGLAGMRERAEHIRGKLEVWSERGAGTEVELRLPASVAYAHEPGRRSIFTRNASTRR